jgi:aminoglycoside 3-N-acetyltransferase
MRRYKLWLKAKVLQAQQRYVRIFRSYDARQLLAALRSLGIREGDAVMLHSSFKATHGFRGTVEQLTDVFVEAVGPQGHLLMVSLPYRTSSFDYLKTYRTFDVRRTPSMMGLVSEMFRRRGDVVRSAHPTHPVLVRGPRASWFIDDHPRCRYPCGPDSPFDRLSAADGKAIFFNVPVATYTFFHYLEHLVGGRLPFPIYTPTAFHVPVIDRWGRTLDIETHVFTEEAIRRRRFEVLEAALRARGLIRGCKIGATRIEMLPVRESVRCVLEMADAGQFFYDMGVDVRTNIAGQRSPVQDDERAAPKPPGRDSLERAQT